MRALIAFDKFKDALTAPDACEIARDVLRNTHSDWTLDLCPLADGGEGFATILTAATEGIWHPVTATGPRGTACQSGFGLVKYERLPAAAKTRLELGAVDAVAIVEMASASGIESLTAEERDPWKTDSRGTGEVIRAAIEAGADAILLGVGGSATNDVGVGALTALGWKPVDADGNILSEYAPGSWDKLAGFKASSEDLPPIRIACDVSNPLLGERGATSVFGPQKGLQPEDRDSLEAEVARIAGLLGAAAQNPGGESTPGAGAAGGIAFGFLTVAGAKLVSGFDLVEEWLGIEPKLAAADLIITGEGCFDDSSLEGKGPGSLVQRAQALGKPAKVFAGAVRLSRAPESADVFAITPDGTDLPTALRKAGDNLAAKLRAVFTE
ncbi:MAG: glycerate kinase [Synoicihabitans sp.]